MSASRQSAECEKLHFFAKKIRFDRWFLVFRNTFFYKIIIKLSPSNMAAILNRCVTLVASLEITLAAYMYKLYFYITRYIPCITLTAVINRLCITKFVTVLCDRLTILWQRLREDVAWSTFEKLFLFLWTTSFKGHQFIKAANTTLDKSINRNIIDINHKTNKLQNLFVFFSTDIMNYPISSQDIC